jgi:signal transduction histidine kinase
MSLQARVTLGIGAVLALVLVALWFTIFSAARAVSEDYVGTRLEQDAEGLLAALTFDANGIQLRPVAISPTYLRPYSGHYFLISDGKALLRSRSLWDASVTMPPSSSVPTRYRIPGPVRQSLLLFVRSYRLQNHEVTIAVAEDLSPLERRIAAFQFVLLYLLAAGLGIALLLQAWSVRRGLAPLMTLRAEVARLKQGEVAAVATRAPQEVAPLVSEINHLLTLIAQRLERSRNAMGDLAHALKGPLSRLVHQAEDPRSGLTPEARTQLLNEATEIRTLVDRELKRARLAGHARPGQHFQAGEELPHLLRAIRGIYRDKALEIELRVDPARRVAVDRDDMLELLGNLLDNAAKWGRSRVIVTLSDGPGLHLTVEDDGPGAPEGELGRLATRGVRLDESTGGTGLGLSIVRAIVNEYGGSLTLGRSPALGGFLAEVQLPPVPL